MVIIATLDLRCKRPYGTNMDFCVKNALELNPRFLKSGFRTQARNISISQPLKVRQMACLMQVISDHTLKHGHACFAFTGRLLAMYNKVSATYQIKPISTRTLTNRLKDAENLGLISRDYAHNHETGQTRRLVSVILDGVKSVFPGVFNYAANCAKKYHARHTLPSSRSDLDNSTEACSEKGFQASENTKNCALKGSKDLSKESDKYNGTPSDSFFLKFFTKDADNAKSLQQSARQGRITASGAKKLIAIHAKHGVDLAQSFRRYLNSVIAKAYAGSTQSTVSSPSLEAYQQYQSTIPTDQDVAEGKAEYYRDGASRMQIRWLNG